MDIKVLESEFSLHKLGGIPVRVSDHCPACGAENRLHLERLREGGDFYRLNRINYVAFKCFRCQHGWRKPMMLRLVAEEPRAKEE